LETVASSLQGDPENIELQALRAELEVAISETENAIAELRPLALPDNSGPFSPPASEKWSREKHPAFQPGYRRRGAAPSPIEEPQAPVIFKVNDTVLAKWVSGDKAFYPARITSITGSSASPVYNVTFKSYGNSDVIRGNDIKPVSNESKKRKADGSTVVPSPPTVAGNSSVISAAANIDPALASQAKKEPSKVSDGPTRAPKIPRKVKANKELEAGKNKWQDFAVKGKVGRTAKKDSMFRTGESANARGQFKFRAITPLNIH